MDRPPKHGGSSERTCEKVHAFATANLKLVAELSFEAAWFFTTPRCQWGDHVCLTGDLEVQA